MGRGVGAGAAAMPMPQRGQAPGAGANGVRAFRAARPTKGAKGDAPAGVRGTDGGGGVDDFPPLLLEAAGGEDPRTAVALDLRARGLRKAPPFLAAARKCRSLDLSCNELEYIDGIGSNTELRELKLYGNRLRLIEGLQRLGALQVLLLNGNALKTVECISHLRQLRTLRLDGNSIEVIRPGDLGRMGSLTSLDLSSNKLTTLAGAIDGCVALEELNVSGNLLETLEGVQRCTKLTELDASRNRLASARGIATLTRLDVLRLNGNAITSVRALAVPAKVAAEGAAQPGTSRAGGGKPGASRAGSRADAPSPLAEAPSCPASGAGAAGKAPPARVLTELYIADNRIADLSTLAASCPQLEVLDASRNALDDLDSLVNVLGALPPLSELQVEGNPAITRADAPTARRRIARAIPNLIRLDGIDVGQADRARDELEQRTYTDGATFRRDQHAEVLTLEEGEGAASAGGAFVTESFMQRANITSLPDDKLAQMASSAGVSYQPAARGAGAAPPRASHRRPATPLEHLGARPCTPLNGKAPTPLMHARPPSARTGAGVKLPSSEQYTASATKFVDDFESYQAQMKGLIGSIRAGLKEDVNDAIEYAQSAGGGALCSQLPIMPAMPQLKEPAQVQRNARMADCGEGGGDAPRGASAAAGDARAGDEQQPKGQGAAVGEARGGGEGAAARPATPSGGLIAHLRAQYGAADRDQVTSALAMFERMYGTSATSAPAAADDLAADPTTEPAAAAPAPERGLPAGMPRIAAGTMPQTSAAARGHDDDDIDWAAWPDDPDSGDDGDAGANHRRGAHAAAAVHAYAVPRPPLMPRTGAAAPGRGPSPAASASAGSTARMPPVPMCAGQSARSAPTKSQLTGRSAERRTTMGVAAAARQGYQRFRPPSAKPRGDGGRGAHDAPLLRPPSPGMWLGPQLTATRSHAQL